MKDIILVLIILLFPIAKVSAQDKKEISITNIQLVHSDDYVTVSFDFTAGQKATLKDYNLVITPMLKKGNSYVQLPEIVVRGIRAKLAEERHRLADRQHSFQQRPLYTENNSTVKYVASVPFENWMVGSQLTMDAVSIGCCSATDVEIGLISDNVLYAPPSQGVEIVERPVQVSRLIEVPVIAEAPIQSTGERLEARFPFIRPVSELEEARRTPTGGLFDYQMPLNLGKGLTPAKQYEVEHFIEGTREGSISILFGQGSKILDRSLGENNRSLVELISAVRAIDASDDSRITRIVIAGFASPEGSLALNERLAWDRAVVVKDFLVNNSSIPASAVSIYNGSVNWKGLKELVEASDMYDKHRVLEIIDRTPVWDSARSKGRLGELMRLQGGDTYRYMYRAFFPQLRQAAFIKVYYDKK